MDPRRLQGADEALVHRVVPAVAHVAHAARDAMGRERLAEGVAGILHAPI